jgi:hypothetical protein
VIAHGYAQKTGADKNGSHDWEWDKTGKTGDVPASAGTPASLHLPSRPFGT